MVDSWLETIWSKNHKIIWIFVKITQYIVYPWLVAGLHILYSAYKGSFLVCVKGRSLAAQWIRQEASAAGWLLLLLWQRTRMLRQGSPQLQDLRLLGTLGSRSGGICPSRVPLLRTCWTFSKNLNIFSSVSCLVLSSFNVGSFPILCCAVCCWPFFGHYLVRLKTMLHWLQ